ncbi:hypothetical protein KKH13_04705 [Patescibacteria group bacterium]|uniref:Uncharacterized protein n=1 Tax=viral metagenome TaxID=1070528 RepID=A0A6M3KPQ0_9ZZZZ|nr:hypothetical protein [Patescibacteria group bacterium]
MAEKEQERSDMVEVSQQGLMEVFRNIADLESVALDVSEFVNSTVATVVGHKEVKPMDIPFPPAETEYERAAIRLGKIRRAFYTIKLDIRRMMGA